ncbi:MAG: Xaa-Pro aminopeptidase [Akkermansiaceae bacterium]|jgi:Xaa-Pro aminopeptidase
MSDHLSFSNSEMAGRLKRIRHSMTDLGLDALITTNAANIRYATGFRGEPRTLLITQNKAILFTSFRSLPWAEAQTANLGPAREISTEAAPLASIKNRFPKHPLALGVDHSISHNELLNWRAKLSPHEINPAFVIEQIRQIKSPAEIDLLQKSQKINEQVFNAILPKIRPGMTERAVQGLILAEIAANEDIDRDSFTPIVAVGPNCWEIHHLPDRTIIKPGDLLLIDLGVIHQGYASDMTRMVCLGQASPEMREIHAIVQSAKQTATDAMSPGVSSHKIDQIARDIIEASGHGRTFTHGLGHSIGLETHDPGLNLSPRPSDTELAPGMALTVEPGIYLEGKFGVRIEDIVIITDEGTENITSQSPLLLELAL